MPYPTYWPTDDKFTSLHNFLLPHGVNNPGVTEHAAVQSLADLDGIKSFILNKYPAQREYEVAELANAFMWTQIAAQVARLSTHSLREHRRDRLRRSRAR
jgi:hypothetical protein